MRDLMNEAPCGFVAFTDDGTIVDVNVNLTEMLGFPRDELIGWQVERILPPGGRIFYHTYLFPMLKVQRLVEEVYLALRTRDGRDVPMLLNAVRRERDGVAVSECVCLRLIQRHEYEEQLLEARRMAEKSAVARTKFLSMMSHDLRTPLTAIYGQSALLETGAYGPLSAPQLSAIAEIREACRTQMNLISDILEFARLDSGRIEVKPRPVPIGEVVARAAALVRLQAREAGLKLDVMQGDDDAWALADPDRLQQVLLNLLTNALKFTPPGGTVSVVCERTDARVRIGVRDTGIGIEPSDLQRIFTAFVQIHGAAGAQGIGLGLAISRDLTRAMGGEILAESVPGRGSTFTVELPAAPMLATSSDDVVTSAD